VGENARNPPQSTSGGSFPPITITLQTMSCDSFVSSDIEIQVSPPQTTINTFSLGYGRGSQGSCETDTQRQNESRAAGHLDLDALDRLIEKHTDVYGRITSADVFIETGKTIPLSEIEERLDHLGYTKMWHGGWRTAKNDGESKVKEVNENTLPFEPGVNSFPSERLAELKELIAHHMHLMGGVASKVIAQNMGLDHTIIEAQLRSEGLMPKRFGKVEKWVSADMN
jgi:hypothetical protein